MSNVILILRKNMARYFFLSMAFWFGAMTIFAILTTLLLKDADILMLGFTSVVGVAGWLFTFVLSLKKQEVDEINKKIEAKADRTELTFLKEKLERFEEMQKEIQHTINSIYKLLIK